MLSQRPHRPCPQRHYSRGLLKSPKTSSPRVTWERMIHKFHVIHGAMKLLLRIGLVSPSRGPGTSFGALNIGCGRGAESRRLRCGLASAARRWGQN
jgi:hypothetical protein